MKSSNEATGLANGDVEPVRHFEDHLPCIWGDCFSEFSVDNSLLEAKAKEIEGLKEEAKKMLMDGATNIFVEKIDLIHTLDRLGVSYHFEKEISGLLEKMFRSLNFQKDIDEHDLYTTSLQFRVFRHHGFKMPCDIFNKFKESSTGDFKESLATDIKGMLSLYEASHMRLRGEDVLEEALAFTTTHLNHVATFSDNITPHFLKQVTRALGQSFYKGFSRLEARFYLSVYEEDESRDELLLKFAKLDFNLAQLLYQQELSLISKWWKKMEFMKKYPYNKHVRDRLVESYFFSVALYFEPCYSLSRVMLTKFLALDIVADDIYDGYGTIEELQLFTDAIDQKCDLSCTDQLPDYMQPLYRAIVELYMEFSDQVVKDGRSYSIHYSQKAFAELLQVNLHEAKVLKKGYIPSFDEYMEVAKISSSVHTIIITSFIGMDFATKETFEWVREQPKILVAVQILSRLQDDIVGTEFEPKASALHCYMKQYNVSRNEAIDKLWEMVTDAWKNIHEEWLTSAVPSRLLESLVNLARFMDTAYKHDDGYDHPMAYVGFINAIMVDPVSM